MLHLSSKFKSNCSGVLVYLQVNMRWWCDVDAKNKWTNLFLGFIIRKTLLRLWKGWRRIDGLRTIFYREDWVNKRAKILGWERNDLDREGVGNGHPPHTLGTKRRFILGAPDSRTKDWWLEGDSICISTEEFSNSENLWSLSSQQARKFPAGPSLSGDLHEKVWAEILCILAQSPTGLPWLL